MKKIAAFIRSFRFRKKAPTTFHKCLAVHMAGATTTSALK